MSPGFDCREHATTALAGLSLLVAQGVLGKTMKDNQALRDLHTYLGATLMGVFVVHAVLGVKEALSL